MPDPTPDTSLRAHARLPLVLLGLLLLICALSLIVASDVGHAFLGSQGDVWLHDRSMAKVPGIDPDVLTPQRP